MEEVYDGVVEDDYAGEEIDVDYYDGEPDFASSVAPDGFDSQDEVMEDA